MLNIKRCGIKFWKFWSRNFWHVAEISATSIFWPKFLVFPKYFPKWAKLSFSSLKNIKNTPDQIFVSIFGQRCPFLSFWVYWRARTPYRSEKRSRSKISQNGPKNSKNVVLVPKRGQKVILSVESDLPAHSDHVHYQHFENTKSLHQLPFRGLPTPSSGSG